MNILSQFTKASASGFFLIIGCTALIASGNIFIGAALFTVALCSICSLGLPLFTGAVGFAKTLSDFKTLGITLLGNMAGCAALGLLVSTAMPEISASSAALVLQRVYPVHTAFISSFTCGLLMYTAVYTYRTKQSYIGVLTCVPAFIIGGFEHSIAYMAFMGLGRTATLTVAVNMLIFVAGNGIGAVTLSRILHTGNKNNTEK